jgi:hypothetical protein
MVKWRVPSRVAALAPTLFHKVSDKPDPGSAKASGVDSSDVSGRGLDPKASPRKRFWSKPGRPYSIRFGGSAMPELGRTQQTRRDDFDVMQVPGKAELAKRHAQQPKPVATEAAKQTIAIAQVLGQQTLEAARSLTGTEHRDAQTATHMAGTKLMLNGLKVAGRQVGVLIPETPTRTENHRTAILGKFRPSKFKRAAQTLGSAVNPQPPHVQVEGHLVDEIQDLRSIQKEWVKTVQNFETAIKIIDDTLNLLESDAVKQWANSPHFEPASSDAEADTDAEADSKTELNADNVGEKLQQLQTAITDLKAEKNNINERKQAANEDLDKIKGELGTKLKSRVDSLKTTDLHGQPLDLTARHEMQQVHELLLASPPKSKDLPLDLAMEVLSGALQMARNAKAEEVDRDIYARTTPGADRNISGLVSDLKRAAQEGAPVDLAAQLLVLPRGIELLEKLAPNLIPKGAGIDIDKNSEMVEQFKTALRVKVMATQALAKLPQDAHASRKWLNGAMRTAQNQLNFDASFDVSKADLAAFHGVRNGYLEVGPGTAHARALARVDKMGTWIERSNSWGMGRKRKSPFIGKSVHLAAENLQKLRILPTRTQAYAGALQSAQALSQHLQTVALTQGTNGTALAQVDPQAMSLLYGLLTAAENKAAKTQGAEGRTTYAQLDPQSLARKVKKLTVDQQLLAQACSLVEAQTPGSDLANSALVAELKASPQNFSKALKTVLSKLTVAEATPAYDEAMQDKLTLEVNASHCAYLAKHNPGSLSPEDKEVGEAWTPPPPPAPQTPLQKLLAEARKKTQSAHVSELWKHQGQLDGQAVADMLSELALSLEQRTKLRTTQGGSIGITANSVSFALQGLIRGITALSFGAKLDIRHTRAAEAILELSRPSHATQLMLGEQKTQTLMKRVGGRFGYKWGIPETDYKANLRADVADHRRTRETQEVQGIYLRVKRDKLNENGPKQVMARLMQDLCTWESPEHATVSDCTNLLDHLLASYPELTLSEIDSNRRETHKRDLYAEAAAGGKAGEHLKAFASVGSNAGNQLWQQRNLENARGPLQVLESRSNSRAAVSAQAGLGLTGTYVEHAFQSMQNADGTHPAVAIMQSVSSVQAEMELKAVEREQIFKVTRHNNTIVPMQFQSNVEYRDFGEFAQAIEKKRDFWVRLYAVQFPGGASSTKNIEAGHAMLTEWLTSLQKLHGEDSVYTVIEGTNDQSRAEADAYLARKEIALALGLTHEADAADQQYLKLIGSEMWGAQRIVAKLKIKSERKLGTPLAMSTGTCSDEVQITLSQWPP